MTAGAALPESTLRTFLDHVANRDMQSAMLCCPGDLGYALLSRLAIERPELSSAVQRLVLEAGLDASAFARQYAAVLALRVAGRLAA